MSRVALESIPSLTFYKNSLTAARRTSPIAQLVCLGKPCALYQPEAVYCKNIGGSGVNVDWKCEADLPSSLRFGKVEVSCEGWSGPGDPYVMKGSCALEYHLVQLPGTLWNDTSGGSGAGWSPFSRITSFLRTLDISGTLFLLVWLLILVVLVYSAVRSYWRRTYPLTGYRWRTTPPRYPGSGSGPGFGSDFWSSGGGGWGSNNSAPPGPPPPYSKDPPASHREDQGQWRPGFWTGTALGALGGHLLANRNRTPGASSSASRPYDWEYERMYDRQGYEPGTARWRAPSGFEERERERSVSRASSSMAAGSGSLGALRTSTGYGGSRSR